MLDIRLLGGFKDSGHGAPVGPLSDSGRTQGASISLSATTCGPVSLAHFSKVKRLKSLLTFFLARKKLPRGARAY